MRSIHLLMLALLALGSAACAQLSVPVFLVRTVSVQGISVQLRIYGRDQWAAVNGSDYNGAITTNSVAAFYNPVLNAVFAEERSWRYYLVHELSHVYDVHQWLGSPRVPLGSGQVAECREAPGDWGFSHTINLSVAPLDYWCDRGEVLARFRALVFARQCSTSRELGGFGVEGDTVCEQHPDFEKLDLAAARAWVEARP